MVADTHLELQARAPALIDFYLFVLIASLGTGAGKPHACAPPRRRHLIIRSQKAKRPKPIEVIE